MLLLIYICKGFYQLYWDSFGVYSMEKSVANIYISWFAFQTIIEGDFHLVLGAVGHVDEALEEPALSDGSVHRPQNHPVITHLRNGSYGFNQGPELASHRF